MKARTGGGKGRHLWPRLVQKVAEGKTSYELSWKVRMIIYIKSRTLITEGKKEECLREPAPRNVRRTQQKNRGKHTGESRKLREEVATGIR